jgi:cysteinyl-tRNA synthetase
MHGEFLTMDDAKMAKSAGNIIRVAELPDLGCEPLAFRYLALTAHYRSKLDFTEDAMHAATSGLARQCRAAPDPTSLADRRAGVRYTASTSDDHPSRETR